MHIRSFREDPETNSNELLLAEVNSARPPPYSGYPEVGEMVATPTSFLVPPPPPPSPGDALKTSTVQEISPIPSAPPPPPLPTANGGGQDHLTPHSVAPGPSGYQTNPPGYLLQVPQFGGDVGFSSDGSLGPSPIHILAFPPAPYGTVVTAVQPEVPGANTQYPPPSQVPVTSTPLMVQPPPPPPPPPLPVSLQTTINNQNVNTNMVCTDNPGS